MKRIFNKNMVALLALLALSADFKGFFSFKMQQVQ